VPGQILEVFHGARVDQELIGHAAGRQRPGEDDDQHQAEPVRGHRVEGQRGAEGQAFGRSAAAPRGDDARERAEDDREERPQQHHRDRVLERGRQIGRDRLLVRERDPEVPVRELLEVEDVLLAARLVEPELFLQRLTRLGGRARHA
jgi:hypothetical protein